MNTYKINIDTKHTIWHRSTIKIEAQSFEEAVNKAEDIFNEKVDTDTLNEVDSGLVEETLEFLKVDENGGYATKEVYVDGDLIFYNSIK
jgi:hypothetical protein